MVRLSNECFYRVLGPLEGLLEAERSPTGLPAIRRSLCHRPAQGKKCHVDDSVDYAEIPRSRLAAFYGT